MSGLTYLITGANRGIGKGLLEALILRPETTIIAAVRDIPKSTRDLSTVKVGQGSKIIFVKIDSTSETDPAAAVEELQTKHNISKIDVVISNAGLLDLIAPVLETPADEVRKHFEVNTIGPLTLIKAFFPLLSASSDPRFLVISAALGSIAEMAPVPFFAYGVSKAAVNFLVRKLHLENPGMTSMAFNPGWVQTDMGTGAAKGVGLDDAPMTLGESIGNLVGLIDGAGREKSGTFIGIDGKPIAW